jgi:O-antigen/teichoic acid export membrane protein
MKESILTSLNFILGGLGILITLSTIVAGVACPVFLIIGLIEKDQKKRKNLLKKALLFCVVPAAAIVFLLVSFALVNVLLGEPVQG